MDQTATKFATKTFLIVIRQTLEDATSAAKAAEACAEIGNVDQGLRVAFDIEQPIYEASPLLDAASLINRLSREE